LRPVRDRREKGEARAHMSLDPSDGRTVSERPHPSDLRSPPRRGDGPDAPSDASVRPGGRLSRALGALLADLGFETATLFVHGADGWELLVREGPARPWHGVLDPSVLEGTDQAAEYQDVRSIPGIGARLAGLGCASVAILPVPDGGRLLLDSERPCPPGGWVERARPYLELLSLLAGPGWGQAGSLRGEQEVAALDRLFAACQEALARSSSTLEELLDRSRLSVGADELFLITARASRIHVLASPVGRTASPTMSRELIAALEHGGEDLESHLVNEMAVALGATSRALVGALGRDGDQVEVLLAGWAEGPALSTASMTVAARTISTARAALEARRQAVTTLVDRERARMAYALHDGLTQTVTGAVLQLDALTKRIEEDPEGALAILETARKEVRRALAELRGMLFDLTPPADEREPEEPLTRYVQDVVKRWRLPARVAVEGDLSGVPTRVLSVAYVVIREALANAAKHAQGRGVTVTLSASDADLVVMVGDGGRGFTREDELAAREAHHVGLELLRRRVGEVGGQLRIESRPGRGTRVIARLPMHGVAS
jgi:signal transduction histidine kinase